MKNNPQNIEFTENVYLGYNGNFSELNYCFFRLYVINYIKIKFLHRCTAHLQKKKKFMNYKKETATAKSF